MTLEECPQPEQFVIGGIVQILKDRSREPWRKLIAIKGLIARLEAEEKRRKAAKEASCTQTDSR